MYWLQRAASDEGVDADWAEDDADLAGARKDPRWPALRTHLRRTQRYWGQRTIESETVVVPKGYTADKPVPVVVALHGPRRQPQNFVGEWAQKAADSLSIAIVSVSGTRPRGPRSFVWAEDAERDHARIEKALQTVRDRVTAEHGKILLMGFSQGAQMSAEIAARHPDRYAGAILLSPGTRGDLSLADIKPGSLGQRRFVVVVGASEAPATQRAADDAERLRAAGADVYHHPYPGASHSSHPTSRRPTRVARLSSTARRSSDGIRGAGSGGSDQRERGDEASQDLAGGADQSVCRRDWQEGEAGRGLPKPNRGGGAGCERTPDPIVSRASVSHATRLASTRTSTPFRPFRSRAPASCPSPVMGRSNRTSALSSIWRPHAFVRVAAIDGGRRGGAIHAAQHHEASCAVRVATALVREPHVVLHHGEPNRILDRHTATFAHDDSTAQRLQRLRAGAPTRSCPRPSRRAGTRPRASPGDARRRGGRRPDGLCAAPRGSTPSSTHAPQSRAQPAPAPVALTAAEGSRPRRAWPRRAWPPPSSRPRRGAPGPPPEQLRPAPEGACSAGTEPCCRPAAADHTVTPVTARARVTTRPVHGLHSDLRNATSAVRSSADRDVVFPMRSRF